jgi:mono/diheme cytochrome c family protein
MQMEATNRNTRRTARIYLGLTLVLTAMVSVSGCHVDMWRQPKIKPYWQSDFFNDEQGSRPLVAHTVARGHVITDDIPYYTGKDANGKLIKTIPVRAVQSFASPKDMLLRGQNRFNAYCSPCHGKSGNGNGFISNRGLGYWSKLPASYQTDRLRKTQDGHLYDTLVNGYGIMYGYGSRIQNIDDRWAVVAYIRALQLAATGGAPTTDTTPTPETEVSGASARNLGDEGTVLPTPNTNEPSTSSPTLPPDKAEEGTPTGGTR